MKPVANLSRPDREELFLVTAREKDLLEAIIEKDFWVCWMLDNAQEYYEAIRNNFLCRQSGIMTRWAMPIWC
jgi:hypothetical protein